MDAAVWGFIGVVLGGIITGVVTLRSEAIRADKEASLDGAKRTDDRRLALDQFQRATLLDLQDAVNDMATAGGEAFGESLQVSRQIGKWRHVPLIGDQSTFEQNARQRVATLNTRVADDDTRDLVLRFIVAHRHLAMAETQEDAEAAFGNVAQSVDAVMDRTGELIRATFRVDATPQE